MTQPRERLRPLITAWAEITAELTAPGAPFELVEEVIGGEHYRVYKHRAHSVREVLANARDRFGDRPAMIFDDGTEFTFADFAAEAASVAAALTARGIGTGDRVAICAANCPGWLLTFWAATSIGAVVVAMNGWWTAVEMQHALDLTEPTVLFGDSRRLERLGPTNVPTVDFDIDFEPLRAFDRTAVLPDAPLAEDDDALLLFTSGTTGRPKAAVLTHRNIVAFLTTQAFMGARAGARRTQPAPAGPTTRLAVFPLFHVSGLSATVGGMMNGTTTIWPLGRFDAATVIDLTHRYGIKQWSGTATHIMRLLDSPAIEDLDPASLASVGIGGSASTPELIRRTEERFPHLKGTFSTGYGSTESGGLISGASNAMLAIAPDCVGPPLPTVDVRIVDEGGEDVPEGEVGNIVCRSPLVMREYWRHPQANADVFLPGRWLKTGDFGRLEDGVLFLASRRRDLILRGGENVYPYEIEYRLDEHPDVVETAVIGVDHPTLGQEIKAIVVVSPGSPLTEDAVRAWCAQTLSSYKVPAHVEIRTEPLPRNASGKILKHLLAEGGESIFVEER
jgi:acyl-CoA synthetase (AMP-forming)/AMP-acid ligase II